MLASIEIDDLCLGRLLRKDRVHTAMPFEIIPKLDFGQLASTNRPFQTMEAGRRIVI
jgi:hypothetical protein